MFVRKKQHPMLHDTKILARVVTTDGSTKKVKQPNQQQQQATTFLPLSLFIIIIDRRRSAQQTIHRTHAGKVIIHIIHHSNLFY